MNAPGGAPPHGRGRGGLRARLASFAVIWTVSITLLVWGGPPGGAFLVAALAGLSQWEFYGLLRRMAYPCYPALGTAAGLLITLGAYFLPVWQGEPRLDAGTDLLLAALLGLALTIVFRTPKGQTLQALMATLMGVLYVPWLLHFLIALFFATPSATHGLHLIVLVVVMAKFNDAGCLIIGLKYGKTPLAPKISPGKSWEGFLGGMVVGAGASALYAFWFAAQLPATLSPGLAALLAVPVGAVASGGDLLESVLKRQAGVKDSGGLFPGIGGALDLTDSMLLATPAAFLLLKHCVL